MVFLGTRGNTAEQIAKAFKWYGHEFEDVHLALKSLQEAVLESEHDNLELKIANRIWGHSELEETAELKRTPWDFTMLMSQKSILSRVLNALERR